MGTTLKKWWKVYLFRYMNLERTNIPNGDASEKKFDDQQMEERNATNETEVISMCDDVEMKMRSGKNIDDSILQVIKEHLQNEGAIKNSGYLSGQIKMEIEKRRGGK